MAWTHFDMIDDLTCRHLFLGNTRVSHLDDESPETSSEHGDRLMNIPQALGLSSPYIII